MGVVRIRPGQGKPLLAGHPWIFAQAITEVTGAPSAGDVVTVVDGRGRFVGKGFWSPKSAIPVRILTYDEHETLEAAFFRNRLTRAASWRKELLDLPSSRTNGYRLVHSEGDGLGGLIVDVFGAATTVQFLTIGMKQRESIVIAELSRLTNSQTLIEIPAPKTRELEGFSSERAVVRGVDSTHLHFRERDFEYELRWDQGQKTGFYFDQRENRAKVEQLARDRSVLDAFCYLGGFSLAALRGGAKHVVAMDSSAVAIAEAATLARHHGYDSRVSFVRADMKRALPQMIEKHEQFDMVILDPPKLIPTARHLEAGRKAYRRLNALALRVVRKGGILVTCSCSAALSQTDHLRLLGLAARDAHRDLVVFSVGQQSPDHPILPAFSEGRYLKCVFAYAP